MTLWRTYTKWGTFSTCSKNCMFSSAQSADGIGCRKKAGVPLHWRDCALLAGRQSIKHRAIRSRFSDVMKLLAALSLTGKDAEEKREAESLKKYFERFSSVVTLVQLSKILGPLDVVSKKMQSAVPAKLSNYRLRSSSVGSSGPPRVEKWLGFHTVIG